MFLEGIRVLELTLGWAGPLAGLYLGDLGAEVIHLEAPASRGIDNTDIQKERRDAELAAWSWGDLPGPAFRASIYPDADPGARPWNRGGHFNQFNRNKLSLCIDLKHPLAAPVFQDLVRVSDVVVSNFSPEGQNHLGLTYEELARYNPQIVVIHLTGYGLTGPAGPRRSWGPILEAHSGLAAATGYRDDGPMKMGVALPDAVGGLHGVVAVLGALRKRDELGHGFAVDISQLETYASYGGDIYLSASVSGQPPVRQGNRDMGAVPQGTYRCRGEDQWVAISVTDDEEWKFLAAAIGNPPLPLTADRTNRQAAHDTIDEWIEQWTLERDKHDAMVILQAAGVRAGAVLTNKELIEDPHFIARGFMVEWDQEDVGRRSFPGFPIHVSDGDRIPLRPTSTLGADNQYVLEQILGYSSEDVSQLAKSGVLAARPPVADS